MGRLAPQLRLQLRGRRKRHTILLHEPPNSAPESFPHQAAAEQGQMNATPGFVPSPERAGGDVVPHALGRASEIGELPIVNDARTVGGQVCDRAALEQLIDDKLPAVLDQMRAVNQQNPGAILPSFANATGAIRYDVRGKSRPPRADCRRVRPGFPQAGSGWRVQPAEGL
jgi:hypothetical protein